MICSSLYLLFFMSVILHGLTDFSTSDWYGQRGAGHSQIMAGKQSQLTGTRFFSKWTESIPTDLASGKPDSTGPLENPRLGRI